MHAWIRGASKEVLQRVYLPGSFFWRLPPDKPGLCLTFDDGPHPEYSAPVLDMLAEAGVKATFYVIGQNVERHPALARRMVDEGHAIAGHGYDHTVITALSKEGLAADLQRCRDVIRDVTGADTTLFRPPKGEVSLGAIRTVCGLGYRLVHWSKTFGDYRKDGTEALLGRIKALPVEPRDILLFHDNNAYTLEALRQYLPQWRAQGYAFETL